MNAQKHFRLRGLRLYLNGHGLGLTMTCMQLAAAWFYLYQILLFCLLNQIEIIDFMLINARLLCYSGSTVIKAIENKEANLNNT